MSEKFTTSLGKKGAEGKEIQCLHIRDPQLSGKLQAHKDRNCKN